MAEDNTLGLLFKIAADPSAAQASIDKVRANIGELGATVSRVNDSSASSASAVAASVDSQAAVVATLREQYQGLAADAANLEGLPFLSGEEAQGLAIDRDLMAQIRAEAAGLGAELKDVSAPSGGIMQSIMGLRTFRALMYSSLGLISFGFYIAEWKNVVHWIDQGSHALGGFSIAAQKAWQDAAKVYNQEFSKKLDYQQEQFKYWSDQVQSLHAQVEKARTDYQKAIEGPPIQGVDMQSYLAGMLVHLRALQSQEQTASGMEAKYSAQISQNTQHHKKNAAAAHAHADALAALILQERNEIEQLGIGDSARRQAVASYDAEIRRIDATTAALKRQKEFTGAEAKKAEEARVLAAQIRDQKLKQIDDKEAARRQAQLAGWEKDTEHTLDRLHRTVQAHRQKQMVEAAHGAAQAGLHPLLGVHGVPSLAGHMTLQNRATLEATAHIDAETRAVWNFHAALMGLAPVMAQFAQEHRVASAFIDRFGAGMARNIAAAIVYGNSVEQAAEKAAKATIAGIAAQAMVQAIYALGLGFFYLGEGIFGTNPKAMAAAAQEFEAAAVFGLVGGAAAAAGAAIPGGGGHGSRAGCFIGTGPSSRGGEPGKGPAGFARGGASGKRTNVYISYGTMAPTVAQQQQLMTALNAGGQLGTVRIHSTDSSAIPAPAY